MAAYLEWLTEVFEEAQVPLRPDTAEYLDQSIRRITGLDDAPEKEVFQDLQNRWLRHGQSGRQLLAALIRGQAFSRRDSPLRPTEGVGYFVNDDSDGA